ncbi:MAG: hypothetical protein AAFZ15_19310 [Bacteroidota bacterium]
MKLLKFAFFLAVALTLSACGDDDSSSPSCTQDDWVGTYTGTVDCDGVTEDVTVNITASGDNAVLVMYETATFTVEFEAITPDGCEIDQSQSAVGLSLTVEATLNGDDLSFKDVITYGGTTATCTIDATRQ